MVGISVIVPTYNEAKYLPRLLRSLEMQSLRNFEVIVADGCSSDLTRKQAFDSGALVMVSPDMEFPSLNRAAKAAKGDTLLFTAADAILPRQTTFVIQKEMQTADALYCPVYAYDAPLWGRMEYIAWYLFTYLWFRTLGEANACTALFAIKRETFMASGGFVDVYAGDSLLSRKLQRSFKVRPIQSLRVPISGRKMLRMGFARFHLQTFLFPIDVFLPPMRSSELLSRLKAARHTKSYQAIR